MSQRWVKVDIKVEAENIDEAEILVADEIAPICSEKGWEFDIHGVEEDLMRAHQAVLRQREMLGR